MVIEGNRAVLDLDRRSWSADASARIVELVDLTAMYGECAVEDDLDNDGKTDYKFRGLELKALADIRPGRLAVGFRYDLLAEEWYESGREDRMETYTLGLTYGTSSDLKFQLNYTWKIWDSEGEPDLDDDRLGLMAQWDF
jgi:hypothetical protein